MKKKLIAMVLGMAVCIGQVEAVPGGGNFPSPIPSPDKVISGATGSIFESLLDNQFGELLSSAMNFLDVCFGMNFNGLSYDDFCNLPKFGAGICGDKATFSLGGFDTLFSLFIKSENNKII